MTSRQSFLFVIIGFIAALNSVLSREPQEQSPTFIVNTSAPRQDTDKDGMLDSWEVAHGLDPNLDDRLANPDNDPYSNIEEYNAGLDPQHPDDSSSTSAVSSQFQIDLRENVPVDSDGDSLPDEWEIKHGLNANVANASEDPDGDGLTNLEEFNGGWNPLLAENEGTSTAESALFSQDTGAFSLGFATDTDKDGMPDWWEVKHGLDPQVNDSNENLDGDELNNLEEYLLGRLPSIDDQMGEAESASAIFITDTIGIKVDSDKDGMPDAWEIAVGLDPLVANSDGDPDQDGRSNIEEYNAGTDPRTDDWKGPDRHESAFHVVDTGAYIGGFSLDTDQDGIPDWWEAKYGLSIIIPDNKGNPDGDSRNNLEEYLEGGDPNTELDFLLVLDQEGNVFLLDTGGQFLDVDGDGIPNWWERRFTTSNLGLEPNEDLDGDGLSNLNEYVIGIDPTDPRSSFKISTQSAKDLTQEREFNLQWNSVAGRRYHVFAKGNINDPWPEEPIHTVVGNGEAKALVFELGDTRNQFYRIRVEVIRP